MLNSIPLLQYEEVHIWSIYLSDNEKDIPCFISILSEDERQRAYSFKFPKDRNCFIISRGILRCLLGKYLGKDPRDIEIIYGFWGKPCLTEPLLYFNLSHSKDYILYDIAHNYEIGIDLEYIDKNLNINDIALTILSSQELAYLRSVKLKEKVDTFFKLWVCKEAFLKASGKGWLNDQQITPLEELDIFKKNNTKNELNKKMITPYYFESVPGYASALFIEGSFLHPLHYTWNSLR